MMMKPMHKIINEYETLSSGGHWFATSTMKFFKTRLPDFGYLKGDDTFFITSESDGTRGRRYTIRKMDKTGDIDTVGDFYRYNKTEARRILASEILGVRVKDL